MYLLEDPDIVEPTKSPARLWLDAAIAELKMARDDAMIEHGLDPEKDVEELNRRIIEMYGSVSNFVAEARTARANGTLLPTYIVIQQMATERKVQPCT